MLPTSAGLTGPSHATLTVTSVTGTIHPGDPTAAIAGTGIGAGVYIVSQTSGTIDGAGVYVTSASTTASSASVTCSSNVLDVSAATGTILNGPVLTLPVLLPRVLRSAGAGRRTLKVDRPGTRDPNARPRIAMFMAAADLGTKPRAGSSYRAARRNAAKIRRHIVNRAP